MTRSYSDVTKFTIVIYGIKKHVNKTVTREDSSLTAT